MKIKHLQAKISLKQEGDKIVVIASDETLDRHGDVLPISQWDLTRFRQAPRMLVDHNHQVEKIVGKWSNPKIDDGKLLLEAVFHDFTPLAKAVKQMVQEGFLNTVSVGFIPHSAEKDGGRESFELIETSWVTVPANPNAQVMAAFKALEGTSLTAEEEIKVKEFVEKEAPELENSDEVLPDDEEEIIEGEEEIKNVVTDYDSFKAIPNDSEVIAITYSFASKLINDSEQLKTLTEKAKVDAEKSAKILQLALKEVAGQVSHSLRELNKNYKN